MRLILPNQKEGNRSGRVLATSAFGLGGGLYFYGHIKFCKQNTAMLIVLRENEHCSILLAEFNMSTFHFC